MKQVQQQVWVAVCTGLVWAGCSLGRAETAAPVGAELPDMVISANRYPVPAANVGSSVTVIDAAQIEQSKLPTVLEVLRIVPGVEVSQSGGPGGVASVFIRGASSSQTLVLIDGVRVNSASLGAFDFSTLSAEGIERVEVLRGPQSTLYGSEAIGGVIAITTKHGAAGEGGSAHVEGGTPEQWRGGAEVHGGTNNIDYNVSATLEQDKGLSAVDKSLGATEDDQVDNVTAGARVGGTVAEDGRADVTVNYFKSKADVDGFDGALPADDPNATSDREGTTASASLRKPITAWWTQSAMVGIYNEQLTGHDPDTDSNRYDVDNRNIDANVQSDFLPTDDQVLSIGYSFEERHAKTDDAFGDSFDKSSTVNSIFGQEQWTPAEGLDLTGGARVDDDSDFGSEPTYRGTASYRVPKTVARVHGSAGTGFKAPTLSDLFFPGFSNPDLDPETSVGYDGGVELSLLDNRASLDVTYFHNAFDNLISYDVVSMRPENIKSAHAQGVEIEGKMLVCTNLQLGANYTYTDTEDEQTGKQLPRRPTHRAALLASVNFTPRLTGTATLLVVNDRIDSDGQPMDNYERVDMTLEYALNSHVYPYVRVENLLDQDYEEVNGFSSPPFTGIGGVRAIW